MKSFSKLLTSLPKSNYCNSYSWARFLSTENVSQPLFNVDSLYEMNKSKSAEQHELDIHNHWNSFYKEILGDIKPGGYEGYLCCYATCAIETEEVGNNVDGHARFLDFKNLIEPIDSQIEALSPNHPDKDNPIFHKYYLAEKEDSISKLPDIIINSIPSLNLMISDELKNASRPELLIPVIREYHGAMLGVAIALSHIVPNKKNELLTVAKSTNIGLASILEPKPEKKTGIITRC